MSLESSLINPTGYTSLLNMSFLKFYINTGDSRYRILIESGFHDNEEVRKYVEVRNKIVKKNKLNYEIIA